MRCALCGTAPHWHPDCLGTAEVRERRLAEKRRQAAEAEAVSAAFLARQHERALEQARRSAWTVADDERAAWRREAT